MNGDRLEAHQMCGRCVECHAGELGAPTGRGLASVPAATGAVRATPIERAAHP